MNRCSIRFTYLLGCLLALISVANHFNFAASSASDILNTASHHQALSQTTPISALDTHLPTTFQTTTRRAVSAPPTPSYRTYTITAALDLPTETANIDIPDSSDSSIYHYRSLYYGHAAYQFGTIKSLRTGDYVVASGITYLVTAINTYTKAYLDENPSIRSQIYNYQDLALMTCGTAGNIDGNYRTVVFAKKV